MIKEKRNKIFAWIFFGLIAVSNIGAIAYYFSDSSTREGPYIFQVLFPLIPILFSLLGALIISRQPRNVIGWLMMLPGASLSFVIDVYLDPYLTGQIPPPTAPTPLFLLILWFSNWSWFLLILPILFILILFPTGRPLSRNWNWLIYFGLGIVAVFVFMITFARQLTPGADGTVFQVPNPIGFLKTEWIDAATIVLLIPFPIWIILCAVSLFVRYRRVQAVEREQIKWLFYAAAIFVVFYAPSFIGDTYSQAENLWNLLLPIGMGGIPIAIAIAILRYRLYDIDIIIRRTLQYALLTGLLALLYFGSVLLLQSLVENLSGEQSPFVIVFSTLGIAALFNPLRIRVQNFIDRRFYRAKYDAEMTLTQFAAVARDEVDMDKLAVAMLSAVDETVHPEQVSLWLREQA